MVMESGPQLHFGDRHEPVEKVDVLKVVTRRYRMKNSNDMGRPGENWFWLKGGKSAFRLQVESQSVAFMDWANNLVERITFTNQADLIAKLDQYLDPVSQVDQA